MEEEGRPRVDTMDAFAAEMDKLCNIDKLDARIQQEMDRCAENSSDAPPPPPPGAVRVRSESPGLSPRSPSFAGRRLSEMTEDDEGLVFLDPTSDLSLDEQLAFADEFLPGHRARRRSGARAGGDAADSPRGDAALLGRSIDDLIAETDPEKQRRVLEALGRRRAAVAASREETRETLAALRRELERGDVEAEIDQQEAEAAALEALLDAECEALQRNEVDLKLDLAIASERAEEIKDQLAAARAYSQKLKDQLMHRGVMPCTSPGPAGHGARATSFFNALLTRFRVMGGNGH
ncbi:hypothetical protein JL721_3012 [Aureococcus anophagefferens]|nr:hypothetical protein JL721_3012 [Aureococcus anophagefferens]